VVGIVRRRASRSLHLFRLLEDFAHQTIPAGFRANRIRYRITLPLTRALSRSEPLRLSPPVVGTKLFILFDIAGSPWRRGKASAKIRHHFEHLKGPASDHGLVQENQETEASGRREAAARPRGPLG